MIVSAPASTSLHAPVVSLAPPSHDSKNSAASKTTPFKNVFDSLTPFEDLQQEGGPGQEGAASKPPTKKELSADSGSGSEEAAVIPPLSPTLPNPSFILRQVSLLSQSADGAVPDNNASPDQEVRGPEPASPGDRSDVAPSLTPSQTTPSSQQTPAQSPASANPVPAALARYPLLPGTARSEMAMAISSRQALSTTPAEKTAATPAKAHVAASSLETPSSVETAGAELAISKPLAAKSVSAPAPLEADPIPAKPVLPATQVLEAKAQPGIVPQSTSLPISTFEVESSRSLATQKVIGAAAPTSSARASSLPIRDTLVAAPAPQATGLRIRASAPVAEPSAKLSTGSVKAPVDISTLIDSSLPANGSSQAVPPPQVTSGEGRTSTQAGSPAAAMSAPRLMSDAPSYSATQPAPPAKTVQQPTPANAQVDPQTPSTAQSTVPGPNVSPAEKRPDPTLAAPAAASTSLPAPLPADRAVIDRESETSSSPVPQHEAPAVTAAPKIPLIPEAENFAFAVRMLGLEGTSNHFSLTDSRATDSKAPVTTSDTPVTPSKGPATQPQASNLQQPASTGNPASSEQPRETQSSAVETEKPDTGNQNQPDLLKAQQTPGIVPHWNDAAVVQAPEAGSLPAASEPVESGRPTLPLAAQETHLIAPELPRTSGTSEILLHLTGNDETSAAIRVADRGGSVNVSVHASDPVLRESLRSNLGDLSTQLNAQGWKADVVKTAAVATHSESQQDSHAGGQRGSQQQQSSGGERQPQRDRRANGGRWQQELDQQTTGGDALPGGNG